MNFLKHLDHIQNLISKLPPCWNEGFQLKEVLLDKNINVLEFEITYGSYYELHRTEVDPLFISLLIDTKDVFYSESLYYVWVEDNLIKHSSELKSISKCFLPLWQINISINHGQISNIEYLDLRGIHFPLSAGNNIGIGTNLN